MTQKYGYFFSNILLWAGALTCLIIGLYVACNHSYQLLLDYNFPLGPISDEAYDASLRIYPVLNGEKPWYYLFTPFADHRVVIERLIFIYDFFFHHGIESANPIRLVCTMGLSFIIFNSVFLVEKINLASKLLIAGISAAFLFAGVSLSNFNAPIFFTWPLIILFSLISFLATVRYCNAVERGRNKPALCYLVITSVSTLLAVFSFNIGLLIWPVVFIVLFKRNVLPRHFFIWVCLAALTYYFYLHDGWHPGISNHGLKYSLHDPIHPFLFFSRIISIPFIKNAGSSHSWITIMIGLLVIILSIYNLFSLWRLKQWNNTQTFLFSCLLFSLGALFAISAMRSWIEAEYVEIGSRFTTPGLLLWTCFLTTSIMHANKHKIIVQSIIAIFCTLWIIKFFMPGDVIPISSSCINKHFIALSIGIPVNQAFVNYAKNYNNENDPQHLIYNDEVAKKYQQGAYSFWQSHYIGKKMDLLPFSHEKSSLISNYRVQADLRKNGNPAIIINLDLPNSIDSNQFDVIFIDKKNKIVGFALPLALAQTYSLWDKLQRKIPYIQTWEGVINSQVMYGQQVMACLVNKNNKKILKDKILTIAAMSNH